MNLEDFFDVMIGYQKSNHTSVITRPPHEFIDAIAKGDAKRVARLISSGANVNCRDEGRYWPIFYSLIPESPANLNLLLQAGAYPEMIDSEGNSILHYAVRSLATEKIPVLLDAGCHIDKANFRGETPLHIACGEGECVWGNVDLLIKCGADMEKKNHKGWTPLITAIVKGEEFRAAETLLSAGADVNATDHEGSNLLHFAMKNAEPDGFLAILDMGFSLNEKNLKGETPFHKALSNPGTGRAEFLVEDEEFWVDLEIRDNSGNTPLHIAAKAGKVNMVKFFCANPLAVEFTNEYNETPIFMAARSEETATTRCLLESGSEINHRNSFGETPLLIAVKENRPEQVRLLLEAGADTSIMTIEHLTPLIHAAQFKSAECLQLLLESGADPNFPKGNLSEPIYAATAYGTVENVDLLLEYGAKVTTEMANGFPPLTSFANRNGSEMCKKVEAMVSNLRVTTDGENSKFNKLVLIRHAGNQAETLGSILKRDVNVDVVGFQGITPLSIASALSTAKEVKLLLDAGADVNGGSDKVISPLLSAASFGNRQTAEVLLTHGADVNLTNDGGATPLHLVSSLEGSRKKFFKLLMGESLRERDPILLILADCAASVEFFRLVKTFAPSEYQDFNKSSGLINNLMKLIEYVDSRAELAKLLVRNDANVNAVDSDGYTPFHLAIRAENEDVIKVLLQAGAKSDIPDNLSTTTENFADMIGWDLEEIKSGSSE